MDNILVTEAIAPKSHDFGGEIIHRKIKMVKSMDQLLSCVNLLAKTIFVFIRDAAVRVLER